ncbi:peptidase inhibitor family I36 protein [Plantactinospora sp. KLBMP9567]|uniref:peptidase inhibitor family I36 protein n=1 Tax=Plantactinospora sp. KLBMP9567 TaxID=3085900 RepID=UPI00298132A3|nr:peptidase inhibitor family I36 protein [Plantactinospora sp. KLBMP9567]MDW5326764.1 peptidase inhibitor family I36 protein [Plantactinospora sp. KLBMP9567]
MTKIRMIAARAIIVVLGSVSAVAVMAPSTASAATPRNGICEVGEVCFYWGPNLTGSLSDFTGSLANYGSTQPTCYEFRSTGTGQGQCMKNNATSAWNRSSGTVRVYYNSNYGGTYDNVAAGTWRNLNNTYLDNASHRFL